MPAKIAHLTWKGTPALLAGAVPAHVPTGAPIHPWLMPVCGLGMAALGGYLLLRCLAAGLGHRHPAASHSHGGRFGRAMESNGHKKSLSARWLPACAAALLALTGAVLAIASLWRLSMHGAAFNLSSVQSVSAQTLGPALFVAGLGLVLGVRHSTDADHVVAISTIVTRERSLRGAGLIGALWGLGHTVTIFLVGCLIILFGVVIPPRVGLSMEFSVALMLILLGILNLTGVMQKIVSRLSPAEALPAIVPAAPMRRRGGPARYGAYQYLRPLFVGLVHGLAGSAAIALLVLSTIHSPFWAVMYLVIFGVGTMLGMMCMTAAMSLPMVYAGDRLPQVSRYLGVASGVVSVCFGSFLVYQLGYLGGLFTSHPHWTPQ